MRKANQFQCPFFFLCHPSGLIRSQLNQVLLLVVMDMRIRQRCLGNDRGQSSGGNRCAQRKSEFDLHGVPKSQFKFTRVFKMNCEIE